MIRSAAASLVVLIASAAMLRAEVDDSVLRAEQARVAVIAKARQAAVAIFASNGQGGGSGVVITPDGYALSNFHVTKGAGDAMKCGMADGKLYDAVIVGIDPVGDVALVKLFGRDDFPVAEMGDSDRVAVGDWCFAVGNPFLLATDFQPTVTYGIVSGVHRYQYPAGTLLEYTDCLQTDASINPGNSGGPLFDAAGQLIGINGRGSFEKRGRVNVGVGYAISINQIKNFLGHLRSGRILDHATLGARVASSAEGRVIVDSVLEDSDAYRRGLREGDEIVRFGGRDVRTVNAFKNVLGIFPKDWRVALAYRRGGKQFEILVRLEGVHSSEELLAKVQGRVRTPGMPDEPKPDPDGEGDPDKQQKDGDQEKRGDAPRQRPSLPAMLRRSATKMPQVVKDHYEPRRGYANYHFNKVERDRVWNRFVARGDFTALDGNWALGGELLGVGNAAGGDAEWRIGPDSAGITLPGGQLQIPMGDNLAGAVEPPGSGGLLAAAFLWRRLLVLGPEKFGDVYYAGTTPVDGYAGLADLLVGTHAGVECRALFDPASGQMIAFELYRTPGEDPCELKFADYAEVEGRMLPREIQVRHGDDAYATFRFDEHVLQRADAK